MSSGQSEMSTNTGLPSKSECHAWVRTLQGGILKTLVETLKDIVFEVSLNVSAEGIKSTTMDTAKQSLVFLKLDADRFEDFHVSRQLHLGVACHQLHKILKSLTANDVLTLFVQANDEHRLGIAIENVEKKSTTVLRVKLLDMDYQEISIPAVDFDRVVRLQSTAFQRLCRDMGNLATTVRIKSSNGKIELHADGDFASQTTILGSGGDDGGDDGEVVEAVYNLKYLTLFGRASNLGSMLSLYIKRGHPLIIEYEAGQLGILKFLLTPAA